MGGKGKTHGPIRVQKQNPKEGGPLEKHTQKQRVFIMYFSKRTKNRSHQGSYPASLFKKKRGPNLATEEKDTPSNKNEGQKWPRREGNPSNTNSSFFFRKEHPRKKIIFYSTVDSTPNHAWTSIHANLIRKPIPP